MQNSFVPYDWNVLNFEDNGVKIEALIKKHINKKGIKSI